MNKLTTLIASAALGLTCTASAAQDSYNLWSGDYWSVGVHTSEDYGLYCGLTNQHRGVGIVTIVAYENGLYGLDTLLFEMQTPSRWIDMVVELYGFGYKQVWTLTETEAEPIGSNVFTTFVFNQGDEVGFFKDVEDQMHMSVVDWRGISMAEFSLIGSTEGLFHLRECQRLIAPRN